MPTTVVNYRKDYCNVRIMRPTIWGNPFVIGRDGTRIQVIDQYRQWIMTQPLLLARLGEIRGKILGCCCRPEICHGDILAELADMPEIELYKMVMSDIIEYDVIDSWLQRPNQRFGGLVPAEMFDQGDSMKLWEVVDHLAAGIPG